MSRLKILIGLSSLLFIANISIWYFSFAEEKPNVLTVSFLDVGQGDAIFIEAPNGNQLLIDAGGGRQVLESLGELMPINDRDIDVVLATHPDQDHIGGIPLVFDYYDVSAYFSNGARAETAVFKTLGEKLIEENISEEVVIRGNVLDLGAGVIFEILYPETLSASAKDRNDYSVVGKLSYGAKTFLLTGDAPEKSELFLLARDGEFLDSDVLKLGHHGSKTSSNESFLRTISPDYAIISAGCTNRYGHPHKEVMDRLKKLLIETLSTCDNGTIIFETDGLSLWRK